MMWVDWGFGSGVFVNGQPEFMVIAAEIEDLGSM